MKHNNNPMTRIRGLVIPVDWDENGKIIAVAISTYDENEYLVLNNRPGLDLRACIRREVEASGFVREARGKKQIEISKFEISSAEDLNLGL